MRSMYSSASASGWELFERALRVVSQAGKAKRAGQGRFIFSSVVQAAMSNIRSIKRFRPTTSFFGNQRIRPLRMMVIVSIPRLNSTRRPSTGSPGL